MSGGVLAWVLLGFAALLTVHQTAHAQGVKEIWSATLTTAATTTGATMRFGYEKFGDGVIFGTLTPDGPLAGIQSQTTARTVLRLRNDNGSGGELVLGFSKGGSGFSDPLAVAAFRARVTFHVGTSSFAGADASYDPLGRSFRWTSSGLTWAAAETYAVRLTLSVPGIDSITFSDVGTDGAFAPGDAVTATVTFNEAVDVTGTPQLEIDVAGTPTTLSYSSGSGTTALVFSGYTVAANDLDADGLSIAANKLTLNGGTIKATADGNLDAVLYHVAVSPSANHRVGPGPEATGTIMDSDPIPQAWLARFGRTVAGHVADAVAERLGGAPGGGSHLMLGGQRVALDGALGGRSSGGPSGGGDAAKRPVARALGGSELLLGSSFLLTAGDAGAGGTWTAWGRAAVSGFDGEADGLSVDGDVTTFTLGADAARGRWFGGVALARSIGEGDYRDHAETREHDARGSGTVESTLTSVHPYVRFRASERLTLWGVLGYGTGDLTLAVDAAGTQPRKTDTQMRMVAAGARGVLVSAAETGGFELAARGDAQLVRMRSDAAAGADGARPLEAAKAQTSRVRFKLEGSHRTPLAGGQTVTPSFEVGLRHDGGDAETGTGIEIGGGLRYTDPGTGFTVDAKARGLVAHEAADYAEWGVSGTVRIDPGAGGAVSRSA